MKKLALAVASALTVLAPQAFAQNYDRSSDNRYDNNRYENSRSYGNPSDDDYRDGRYRPTARVIESRPLYAAGEARQECWNNRAGHYEELRGPEHQSALNKGTVLGALVGGVVGHQVGSGRGNDAATVGGALLGGLAGNKINRDNNSDDQPDLDKSRCRVVADNNVPVRGYEVRYAYRGQEYVTRTESDPGSTLRLGRDIRDDGTPFDVSSNGYPQYSRR